MLQGLTRAVTCLLLLLSIKMYPQLGEVYHIKVGRSSVDVSHHIVDCHLETVKWSSDDIFVFIP